MNRAMEVRFDGLVKAYGERHGQLRIFRDQLLAAFDGDHDLGELVHSFRSRLKDPEHLREKLRRRLAEFEERGQSFDITNENLFAKINDLVGIRLLHLYTTQSRGIDRALRRILVEGRYKLMEKPFARTWDDESREFFQSCGIKTRNSPSLYTSVHYVVGSASRTKLTAEIQVRTLMEEVWGEVDHAINYPQPAASMACREQIKVLARVTSSATRLVDSIFRTFEDSKTPGGDVVTSSHARGSKTKRASGRQKR